MHIRSVIRTLLLLAGCIAAGIFAAVLAVILGCVLFLPRPTPHTPGDGILPAMLLVIFVPVGAIAGVGAAITAITLKTKTQL